MAIFTAISYCSGYDGIGLGLELVIEGYKPVCYIEREAHAIENLISKMEARAIGAAPIWNDVGSFVEVCDHFKGVDIVHGGIPCTPFSVAGKKEGLKDERWLWPQMWESVRRIRPRYIMLENVPGFVRQGLEIVLGDLAESGYNAEWDTFRASDLGAPHKRERFFLLAKSKDSVGAAESPRTRLNEGRLRPIFDGSSELDDSRYLQSHGRDEIEKRGPRFQSRNEPTSSSSDSGELANPESQRVGGEFGNLCKKDGGSRESLPRIINQSSQPVGQADSDKSSMERNKCANGKEQERTINHIPYLWPARPNEPQYEWEEPRVVEKPSSERLERPLRRFQRDGVLGPTITDGEDVDNTLCRRHSASNKEISTGRDANIDASQRQTKPRLGRAANGTPSRADRLFSIGNGVVPQAVAVAWLVLESRLEDI